MNRAAVKDIPEDFAEWAKTENDTQLGLRFDITRRQSARMRRNLGITSNHPRVSPPKLPDDFVAIAVTRTITQLRAHYDVGDKTIHRWIKESGAVTRTATTAANKTAQGPGQPYNRVISGGMPPGVAPSAARHLRERGYRPVYDRIVEDKALKGQYVVGRRAMTTEGMIALAVEKGFNNKALYL